MKKLKNKVLPNKLQFYLQKATTHLAQLPTRKTLIDWVKIALQNVPDALPAQNLELTMRLVDTAESAQLNEQYRQKRGPTNILSFAGGPDPAGESSYYLGDLVVCVPLVFQEAAEQDKPAMMHWAHLTVHGVLHLLGYDHIKPAEAAAMEALEIKILEQLGYKNPYISKNSSLF